MQSHILWKSAADSHSGKQRQNNEDRVYRDDDRGIFVVIDGVGGAAAGEEAADIALSRLRTRLERKTGSVRDRIREAITSANNEIYRISNSEPQCDGMACVLTVAVVENGQLCVGHVGDTRLYEIRRGEIHKITHDHSPVGEREDAGELNELDAMHHPQRNEVYRAVGSELQAPDNQFFIEMIERPLQPDSALLLCTDGLTDLVPAGKILQTVTQHAGQAERSVAQLIEEANRAGGKDNISIIVVEGPEFPPRSRRSNPQNKGFLSGLVSRRAMFLYGLLLGAALLAATGVGDLGRSNAPHAQVPEAQPQATRLLVDPAGELTTIAAALERARPGDTVDVTPGQYSESIQLKEGVTVASLRPREAILRLSAAPSSGQAAAIGARGIRQGRLTGFKIIGDPNYPWSLAVHLLDSDITIEDIEISQIRDGAVLIEGTSKPVLRGNYIHDNAGTAIVVRGTARPRLMHNLILRNGTSGAPRPGLEVAEGASAVLVENLIAYNSALPSFFDPKIGEQLRQDNFVIPALQAPAATPVDPAKKTQKPPRQRPLPKSKRRQ
ncbi:MAG: protein phosphatase 2C domain-containing protein [Acidobacteriota bacterium]